jgi:hypothetical protein
MTLSQGKLSVSELRKLLEYDPKTGSLRWKVDVGPRARAGNEAGHLIASGHQYVKINGIRYASHRIILGLYAGEWPQGKVEHINGVYDDNRIANLHVAAQIEKSHNRQRSKTNSSGVTEVLWQGFLCPFAPKDNRQVGRYAISCKTSGVTNNF